MTKTGEKPTYSIDDPRSIAAEAPYTFFLPTTDRLALLRSGDLAKLIFREIPADKKHHAERMWVEIDEVNEDMMSGRLASKPDDMPQLNLHDTVHFNSWQIIDYRYAQKGRDDHLPPVERREYWERCFVDKCVLDDNVKVGFLYREKPDMTRDGDKYPDSGWRIRGQMRGCSDAEIEARKGAYIALGKVLNQDDSWLHLIDEPAGSQFFRSYEDGQYYPDEEE